MATTSHAHEPPPVSTRAAVPIISIVAFCLLLAGTLYAVVRYGAGSSSPRTPAGVSPPAEQGPAWAVAEEAPNGVPAAPVPTDELEPALGAPQPAEATEAFPPPGANPAPLSVPSPVDAGLDANADAAPTTVSSALPAASDAGPDAAATVPRDAALEADAEPTSGVPCGATTCPADKICCNESCGTCVSPGQTCSQLVCGMPVVPGSASCGPNTCNVGELCCNPSCGICVSPGETCDQRRCSNEVQYVESQWCGMQTCNTGFVCCNPSCGTCKRPNEACSQDPCT